MSNHPDRCSEAFGEPGDDLPIDDKVQSEPLPTGACIACDGRGFISGIGGDGEPYDNDCKRCSGTGKLLASECPVCHEQAVHIWSDNRGCERCTRECTLDEVNAELMKKCNEIRGAWIALGVPPDKITGSLVDGVRRTIVDVRIDECTELARILRRAGSIKEADYIVERAKRYR